MGNDELCAPKQYPQNGSSHGLASEIEMNFSAVVAHH